MTLTKLDEYFTSVRGLERQVELSGRWADRPKTIPGMPEPEDEGFVSDLPALYDLVALALQTDSTRIATIEIAGGFESKAFGIRKDYHGLSHHGQVKESIDNLLILETYQIEQFARSLGKLKNIKNGDGSLLDHTMILFGSGMGNFNAHTNMNLAHHSWWRRLQARRIQILSFDSAQQNNCYAIYTPLCCSDLALKLTSLVLATALCLVFG